MVSINPQFYLKARDNTTLLVKDVAIENDFLSFSCQKKWNDVGTWTLTLHRDSPHAATFLPDGSGNLHTGILLQVNYGDGQGLLNVLTGPQLAWDVTLDEQNNHLLIASGACDNIWLQRRVSLPFAGYPYQSDVILGHGYSPVRYYTLGDSSGTTAVDSSTSAVNATYNGGCTLGQAALIDDPPTSTLLNGTTGFISVPTTGLPSGNSAVSAFGWGLLTALPGAAGTMWSWGSAISNQAFQVGILSSGIPYCSLFGHANVVGTTPITLGIPFLLGLTWDGTTLKGFCFQNGNKNQGQFGSQTPGAASIVYGAVSFGRWIGNSQFWNGYLGHGAFFNQDMSAQLDVSGLYPWPTWAYRVGLSKLAFKDYAIGFSQGAVAEHDLNTFVGANLSFPSDRAIPNFSRPLPSLGATCSPTYSRMDNVLTLAQSIGLKSTPQLGFRLEQVAGQMLFSIFESTDRTSTAVFSLARNNVRTYKLHGEVAKVNYYYAGGVQAVTGVPESRVFVEGGDSTSISQFGRMEAFLDDRSAPDQATLRGAIAAGLAANAALRTFEVTTRETDALYFMGPGDNGYDVGDTVKVVLEGQTFTDVVREVDIDLEPGAAPVVTAIIGTPGATNNINDPTVTTANSLSNNLDAISSLAINY